MMAKGFHAIADTINAALPDNKKKTKASVLMKQLPDHNLYLIWNMNQHIKNPEEMGKFELFTENV